MDATHENWSAIARRAFELQLNSTMKVGAEMDAVIERLRASKQKIEEEQRPVLTEYGREWAMEVAEYDQLTRVAELEAELENYPDADALFEALCQAMYEDTDKVSLQELTGLVTGHAGRRPSRDQLCWYLEGIQQVWNEVSDKI
ncbi:hypothetical protein SF83666_c29080 [Sinorhizobium fredii CCBAU 83666]|nr:hypothetical protein SF83666_c29080 [Sinorhizobium fredii CCBAU 83666]